MKAPPLAFDEGKSAFQRLRIGGAIWRLYVVQNLRKRPHGGVLCVGSGVLISV